ncbi:tetratricopeptide repeat protein [Bacillus benzoevorans]|uniref:tetratricopeptide repeat protein n=1 Tax=Bacillus benzoevorans TaxID=1456 RepID=UPI00366C09EB
MKKTKHGGKDGNIIRFPDLDKRLLEKGQEYLQRENYHEAITLFQETVQLDPSNSEGCIGLILAYYGAGYHEDAVELAKVMLHEGIGNYFDIMDLYIKLLFQVRQYSEIVTLIEGLLAERTIPSDRLEHYYSMLDIARQIEQEDAAEQTDHDVFTDMEKDFQLKKYTDPQEQLILAANLAKINIQPYLNEIKSYLCSDKGMNRTETVKEDPFFKTLLLNVLMEHQVEQPVEVHKFGKTMSVIPKDLVNVNDIPELREMTNLIGGRIEHDDPILYESIKMLIHRQFFLLYPFPLEARDIAVWAAAYHVLGCEYFGNHDNKSEILEEYHVQEADFARADAFIRMIEEISYPNI